MRSLLDVSRLPLVFTEPRFRFTKADRIYLIVSYPKRATRREFYNRRHYTAPFQYRDKRIENVLVGFEDREAARALAGRLTDLYRIGCEPLEERMGDAKYYASLIRMPLVVRLADDLDAVYFYH